MFSRNSPFAGFFLILNSPIFAVSIFENLLKLKINFVRYDLQQGLRFFIFPLGSGDRKPTYVTTPVMSLKRSPLVQSQ
jgi:hypothetical protein